MCCAENLVLAGTLLYCDVTQRPLSVNNIHTCQILTFIPVFLSTRVYAYSTLYSFGYA
jgi:hypothetical protein